ncbi:MAG: tyrosine-type recombinase/integrase [Candidatus Dormibacteraceae bacterium]
MSSLAPTLQAFFTDRLGRQRSASPHTVASYRDTFRMLLVFARDQTGKAPSTLVFEDLSVELIVAFLEHAEKERGNSVRTRNVRLAAIHSFFHYASFQHPEHASHIQRILAIPHKRGNRALVSFLQPRELDAILNAPDQGTWVGRRDAALLTLTAQTGLRVSELINLQRADLHLGPGPYVHCTGKGRKERCTPLTRRTAVAMRAWLAEQERDDAVLFPSLHGGRLSPDAVQVLLGKYTEAAATQQLSLADKTVTPHVLRHTCAMNLLQRGIDTSVIALWLGHESVQTTQIYLHADMTMKEHALALMAPLGTRRSRYRPSDELLAFLAGR